MIVYLVSTLFTCAFTGVMRKIKTGNHKIEKGSYWIYGTLSVLPWIFITIFRKDTGTDYHTYTTLYYTQGLNYNGRRGIEIISSLIFKIATFLKQPRFSIIIYGLICCIFSGHFILKNSKKYKLSAPLCVLFFFLSGSFNWGISTMRQMAAVAMCIDAYELILQKKPIKYFAVVLVATLIHKTAIIFAILYFIPLDFISKRLRSLVVILALSPFLTSLVRPLIIWVCQKFNFYALYFGHEFYDQQTFSYSLIILTYSSLFLPIYTYKKWKDDKFHVLLFLYMYMASLFSGISKIIPNSSRIVYMFIPMLAISMPCFIKLLSKKIKYWVILAYLVLFLAFFVKFLYLDNQCGTFPFMWLY